MAKERIIAGIDIGDAMIRTVIGVIKTDSKIPQIIGVGSAPSLGMRKGQVIDVEETINSISASLEEAERMSGELVHHAVVGIGGPHITATDAKGVIAVQGEEIIDGDVERVLETAQAISLPQNKQVLKIIPKFFTIDSQKGIRYPVGMVGKKLEVEAHILSGLQPAVKNVEKCVHEAGVDIDDLIPTCIAAPEAVLTKRQKELGVVVIDIGHGGTSLSVFEESSMLYTTILPIGGESVTNDIAIGLRTGLDIAERLKVEYGSCSIEDIDSDETIDLKSMTGETTEQISRQYLAKIIEARYYEIFHMVKAELKEIRRDGMLPAGAILTGGGAKIPGLVELARGCLNLPTQLGFPIETSGVIEQVDDPAFATCVGLLLWGTRMEAPSYGFNIHVKGMTSVKGAFDSIGGFLKKLLP